MCNDLDVTSHTLQLLEVPMQTFDIFEECWLFSGAHRARKRNGEQAELILELMSH